MGEVADDLEVSANELQVLIETLDVPFPFSGYWARTSPSEAKPPQLRRAKPDKPESVEITTVPALEPQRAPRPPEPSESTAGVAGGLDARRSSPAPRLVRPHRYIAARLEEYRRSEARWRALGVGGRSQREDESTRRRRIIGDLVFKEVERRGHADAGERRVPRHPVRHRRPDDHLPHPRALYAAPPGAAPRVGELNDPSNVALGRTHTQVRLMTGELVFAAEGLEKRAADAAARAAERAAEEARYGEEQVRREEIRRQQLRNANQWRRFRNWPSVPRRRRRCGRSSRNRGPRLRRPIAATSSATGWHGPSRN